MTLREITSDLVYLPEGLVSGKSILVETGSGQIRRVQDASKEAEYFPGLICPGFINSHCHLELSHLKGKIPPQTGMAGFISRLQAIREDSSPSPFVSAQSEAERAFASGTQAIADISNSLITAPLKNSRRPDLPVFYTFLEVFGLNPSQAHELFRVAQEKSGHFPESAVSLTWHAPYSLSPELFQLVGGAARQNPGIYSIHLLESLEEIELMENREGKMAKLFHQWGFDPLPVWMRKQGVVDFVLSQLPTGLKILWVHGVHLQEEDVQKLRMHSPESAVCLCPTANQYIHGTLAPAGMLWKNGMKVVLGTDSLAGNEVLEIGAELKFLSNHFPEIPTEILLSWATGNGADFFGWDSLGKFTIGGRPGVLQIFPLQQGRIFKESFVQRLI
jgi:cytosine/adenosine deaminase-related metal-dependent hydrolase